MIRHFRGDWWGSMYLKKEKRKTERNSNEKYAMWTKDSYIANGKRSPQKNVGAFSKILRRFWKNVGHFLKNVGVFSAKVGRFLHCSIERLYHYRKNIFGKNLLLIPHIARTRRKNVANRKKSLLLDVKTSILTRTHTRTLQEFCTFCFHNLHRHPL